MIALKFLFEFKFSVFTFFKRGIDFEKLGLVKEDNLQKVEIIAEKDETAEHFEVEEQDNGMLATVMNALYRNFKEYRNIFLGSE